MIYGELIHSSSSNRTYKVVQPLKGGGQAEVAFVCDCAEFHYYFLKKLLNIKYTDRTRSKCDLYESYQRRLYEQLRRNTMPNGSCPSIVDFFRERTFYYVVTERIAGIPCKTEDIYKYMTIDERIDLFKIIVYSFYPLEKAGVIHADVKPENILIKKINNHYVSKLIDLESAFFANNPPPKGSIVGTDPYTSPEVFDYNDEDNEDSGSSLSSKSDIFSLGIILYEFVCGKYPNSSENELTFEMVKAKKDIPFPSSLSKELISLISKMLKLNPKERPDVQSVLSTLKQIPDVSYPPENCYSPKVFVERTDDDSALVHLFVLGRDTLIKYSIDGEDFETYSTPICINEDDITLNAYSYQEDDTGCETITSSMITCEVSVECVKDGRVDKPFINIDNVSKLVDISCGTSNAMIYFTIDGSEPSHCSQKYINPFYLSPGVTVKAIAYKRGMFKSEVASRNTSSTTLRMS